MSDSRLDLDTIEGFTIDVQFVPVVVVQKLYGMNEMMGNADVCEQCPYIIMRHAREGSHEIKENGCAFAIAGCSALLREVDIQHTLHDASAVDEPMLVLRTELRGKFGKRNP